MCGQQKWAIEYIPDGEKLKSRRISTQVQGWEGHSAIRGERHAGASF